MKFSCLYGVLLEIFYVSMWYLALLSAEISVKRQVGKKAFTKIINCKCSVRFLRCRLPSPELDPSLTDIHTLTTFPCLSSKCPY